MKIARFCTGNKTAYGVIRGEEVAELAGSVFDPVEFSGRYYKLQDVQLLAPIDPPNVIAIGLNYRSHAEETGAAIPQRPIIFLKATTSIIGPEEPIVLPQSAPNEVDYEAELAVIIGRKAKNVPEADALDYVLGYTCGNDVSARDCQLKLDQQWARGKSFDSFCPLGPWIATELDPDHQDIGTRLNGTAVQRSNTSDLIFSVRTLVAYCSHNMTLLPGTVILTGTPEGVGVARSPQVFLRPGDQVEVEVAGIGVLKNPVQLEV